MIYRALSRDNISNHKMVETMHNMPLLFEVKVYHMKNITQIQLLSDDLPDEFFEVTEQDIRNLWAEANRKM